MHCAHRSVIALVGALVFIGTGCTSSQLRLAAADYRAALLAAITHIERSTLAPGSPAGPPLPLTLVISNATPEALRQACTTLRPTVYDYNLPDADTVSLPSGHLQPQSLVITGDTAVFKGVLGPVPLAGTPASRRHCGTTFQIRLLRHDDRSWRKVDGSSEHCARNLPRLHTSAA